jgi:hypothetical protein
MENHGVKRGMLCCRPRSARKRDLPGMGKHMQYHQPMARPKKASKYAEKFVGYYRWHRSLGNIQYSSTGGALIH